MVLSCSVTGSSTYLTTGHGSSVGYVSALYADNRQFDPHVRQHSLVESGHEKISTAILPSADSVTGERICTKYW